MLPSNPEGIFILGCHSPIIPNRTEHKTRPKQRYFILQYPSSEYFTSPDLFRNNHFRSHHSPGNLLSKLITEKGRRLGYLRSRRIKCTCLGLLLGSGYTACQVALHRAGQSPPALISSSPGLALQDPSWLSLHHCTMQRFWEGLLVLTLIQLCLLPPLHHRHCFHAIWKIPPKTADSWLCTHGQFMHSVMHTLCYLCSTGSKIKWNKVQFNMS